MSLEIIIVIYLVGLGLLIAEAFIPGMIVGLIGAIALIFSIHQGFLTQGAVFGIIQLVIALIVLPLLFLLALKRLALKKSLTQAEGFTAEKDPAHQLLGLEGITLNKLRPAGTALINGKKVDVVTEGAMVNPKTQIKVIKTEGNRVVVRTITEQ